MEIKNYKLREVYVTHDKLLEVLGLKGQIDFISNSFSKNQLRIDIKEEVVKDKKLDSFVKKTEP